MIHMHTKTLQKTAQRRGGALSADQEGMVSILVTMVLMIVISLIVLGFAQISRRNQRVTLDQQLSTQAFYAAESGVNDTAKLINDAIAHGNPVYPKPACGAPASGPAATFYSNLPSATIDAGASVSYSCLIVNPTPPSLVYGSVSTTSTIIPVTSGSGAPFNTLTLSWQSKSGSATPLTGCPASTTKALLQTTAWTCGYGVLRFDLVPTAGGSLTAAGLAATDMTSFVVPVNGGTASVPFAAGGANGNDLIAGNCTNTGCSLTITGLSSAQYYARVTSLYQDSSLQITGTTAAGSATFSGAQTMIDATGKAQDVLRRIQVRVSTNGTTTTNATTQLPDYALESTTSICKRFAVMQNYFQNNAATADGSSNQLCH